MRPVREGPWPQEVIVVGPLPPGITVQEGQRVWLQGPPVGDDEALVAVLPMVGRPELLRRVPWANLASVADANARADWPSLLQGSIRFGRLARPLQNLPRAHGTGWGKGIATGWALLPEEARLIHVPATPGGWPAHTSRLHDVNLPLVWPGDGDAEGKILPPLDPRLPALTRDNPRLRQIVAAIDAYRTGRARDRTALLQWLERQLGS